LRQYEEAWQSRPDSVVSSLKAFAVNRIEFALHEIGHIAAYNKSIVVRESAVPELKKMRADLENMLNVWPNPEIGRERIPHVLSDLRAEVFRRFCSLDNEAGRDQSSFSSIGVQERVFEGGVLRCPTIYPDSILRMLAWYPVCKALGPEGSPEKVMSSATKAARSYHSSLTSLVPLAAEYFDLYFTSRCYDKQRLLSRLGGEY
ncbi:MAG: hypothetical protein KDD62_08170, partial [Bdellovibrionales bacterium]|nr:hypothetical protein [Bdellovibrionales bacterium]